MSGTLKPFEADVGRVLEIVVHSLYKQREIFLRELISNASDACDRLRYLSLREPELLEQDPDLRIEILLDPGKGLLTVRDNGIGMSAEELASHLGTVARSGTRRFLEALEREERPGVELIGQFGVGFYAAFMVADRVVVVSRKAGEEKGHLWISDGRTGFEVREAEERPPRGTAVTLHLREDAKEFLDPWRIRQLVQRYSDHIAFPIFLETRPKPGDSRTNLQQRQQVNRASALWTRPREEIGEDQYREFYRHVAHAFDEPFARIHFRAEGRLAYTALLFIPTKPPFDLLDPHRRHGVKLYVKRVFVTDAAEDLLPRYLRFVVGVVDSEDLPLNVSRETLQQHAVVASMRKALTRRVLDELARKAKGGDGEEKDGYLAWWESFGPVLKEGLYEDEEHRERLLELVRFRTTAGDGWVALSDYVARMKPGQDAIYTISGENPQALRAHPQLEAALAKGVEVLLLTDPVDAFWLSQVRDYRGKPFRSLTRGEVDLSKIAGDEPASERGLASEQLERLIARFKRALGDQVREVRASKRLRESAVCLVADEAGMDLRLERFLYQHGQIKELGRRILEINPAHEVIRKLAAWAEEGGRDEEFDDVARLLLDQARIVEGDPLPDPGGFSRRMSRLVARALD